MTGVKIMIEKFIYVFSESDKDTLLSHGYDLIKEPKKKKTAPKKRINSKLKDEVDVEPIKEEKPYWVFLNKSARDMILKSLDNYVLSNQLSL